MLGDEELDLRAFRTSWSDHSTSNSSGGERAHDEDRRAVHMERLTTQLRFRAHPVTLSHFVEMISDGVRGRDVARARAGILYALQVVADVRSGSAATFLANRLRSIHFDSVLFACSNRLTMAVHLSTAPLRRGVKYLGLTDGQLNDVVGVVERMARAFKSRLPSLMNNVLGIPTQASARLSSAMRARAPQLEGWFQSTDLVHERLSALVLRVWSADEIMQLMNYMAGRSSELVVGTTTIVPASLPHGGASDEVAHRYLNWYPVLQAIWERGTMRTRRAMLTGAGCCADSVLMQWLAEGLGAHEPLFLHPLVTSMEGTFTADIVELQESVEEGATRSADSKGGDEGGEGVGRSDGEAGDGDGDGDDDEILNARRSRVLSSDWAPTVGDLATRAAQAQLYMAMRSPESICKRARLTVDVSHVCSTDMERELTLLFSHFLELKREAASLHDVVPARTGAVPRRYGL